jgi:hypothetical protein
MQLAKNTLRCQLFHVFTLNAVLVRLMPCFQFILELYLTPKSNSLTFLCALEESEATKAKTFIAIISKTLLKMWEVVCVTYTTRHRSASIRCGSAFLAGDRTDYNY